MRDSDLRGATEITPGEIRTPDQRIRNPLLYPLSYGRKADPEGKGWLAAGLSAAVLDAFCTGGNIPSDGADILADASHGVAGAETADQGGTNSEKKKLFHNGRKVMRSSGSCRVRPQ